jgi:hypothetical protein
MVSLGNARDAPGFGSSDFVKAVHVRKSQYLPRVETILYPASSSIVDIRCTPIFQLSRRPRHSLCSHYHVDPESLTIPLIGPFGRFALVFCCVGLPNIPVAAASSPLTLNSSRHPEPGSRPDSIRPGFTPLWLFQINSSAALRILPVIGLFAFVK